jgi:hypothetical protein
MIPDPSGIGISQHLLNLQRDILLAIPNTPRKVITPGCTLVMGRHVSSCTHERLPDL